MDEYTDHYNKGWRYAVRAGGLDNADRRGLTSHKGWMDGYLDQAAGRVKWHYRDCRQHHNGPGGCGEA